MLKKTITYKDLDGNPVTEDFYFKLNKAEIAELEFDQQGGLTSYLTRIIASQDGAEIMALFKKIILMSVGRRSEDGRRFIKNDEVREYFLSTDAYSELFMELVTNSEAASAFVRGIVPSEMQANLPAENVETVAWPEGEEPAWKREGRLPNQAEIEKMSPQELISALNAAKGKSE